MSAHTAPRPAETRSPLWTQVSNQRISRGLLCQNPHSNPSHFVHTVAPLKRLSVCVRATERQTERDPAGKCDFLRSWVALLKPIRFTMTNLTFLQCCRHKRPLFSLLLKTLPLRFIHDCERVRRTGSCSIDGSVERRVGIAALWMSNRLWEHD